MSKRASTSDHVKHEATGWGGIILVGLLVVIMLPSIFRAVGGVVVDSAKESVKTPLGAAAATGGAALGAKKLHNKYGGGGGGGGGAAAGGGAAGKAREKEPEAPPETTTTQPQPPPTTQPPPQQPRISREPLGVLQPPRRGGEFRPPTDPQPRPQGQLEPLPRIGAIAQ